MDMKYTLVQHTGYTVTDHADFEHAVEERAVTPPVARRIQEAGGLVFDTYSEAVDAGEAENYPPGVTGLVPRARGGFRRVDGIGEPVYYLAGNR